MKKLLPILLALLLLTACGAEPAAPAETKAPETAAPAPETEAPAPSSAPEGETLTVDGEGRYLRLTLPAGWTWTEAPYGKGGRGLLLCAPTEDGFQIGLNCEPVFLMLDPDTRLEDYPLPGGEIATVATEVSAEARVDWTLILPPEPSQFTLSIHAPQSVIDAHQAEIDAILASLVLGELSELPPQPKDVEA